MAKVRVHELAKELNINSKDLVPRLVQLGLDVKNHMSTIEGEVVGRVKALLLGKAEGPRREGTTDPERRHTAPQPGANRPGPRPAPESGRAPRPAGQGAPVPRGREAAPNPAGARPPGNQAARPTGERPLDRPAPRPEGQGPGPGQRPPGSRPGEGGQRPFRPEGQGPQGPRPPRPEGQGPGPGQRPGPRPGDGGPRPFRPEGQGPQGPRPPRPEGQGPGPGQRPPGPRPGDGGPRPFRPEWQGPQGPRPPRPEGQGPGPGQRPPGPRPGDGGPRPFRPDGQGPRPFRPEGQGPGPGQRPPGQRPGDGGPRPFRPDGQGPRPPRPGEGPGRPAGRPAGGPPGQRPGPRPDGGPGQRWGDRGPGQGRPGQPGRPGGMPAIPQPPQPSRKQGTQGATPAKTQPDKRKPPAKPVTEQDRRRRYDDSRGRTNAPSRPKPKSRTEEVVRPMPKHITISESITVQDLANKLNRSAAELIKKLMVLGMLATINQEVDAETAILLAGDFGVEVEVRLPKPEFIELVDVVDAPETQAERPPVVTVMGHVDHGKTSLLDAIRHTRVTAQEAGGITQHIGAYQVEINNRKITFLDTPGHEAFTAMRARGAQVTDIAILVVAADDGVMPQTVEAINHAKAAEVPIVVAVNKIDKPNANPERVKQELTEHGLVPEEWGGTTICVPVSAKTTEGIATLLEMLVLVADIGELKANPERLAYGTVIEAELDKNRGPVATVLVQKGTLQIGDTIVAGSVLGKVRAMIDDNGRRVKKAGPSTPVEVLGFSEVPEAGDVFQAVEDEKIARLVSSQRQVKKREEELKPTARVTLDDLFKQIQEGEVKDLNVIIKGDVQGSVEALRSSLERLSTKEVRVNTIHVGVGGITESDVMFAIASNAIIIGFNVRPDNNARRIAENEKVDLRLYRVIYDALNDVKAAMSGLLDPVYREVVLGHAEVRAIFKVPKIGVVAGCYVTDGKILRNASIRVLRDSVIIHEGKIDSLKRFKDDVKEVVENFECGLGVENFNDVKEGDIIEAYTQEEVKRQL